jgi:hypothetical protein
MKQFGSVCQSVFRRKITIVAAVLLIPALVVGSNLVKHMPPFASTANCLSCVQTTPSNSQSIGHTNYNLKGDSLRPRLAQIALLKKLYASTRTSEKRATPPPARTALSPVKTNPVPTNPPPVPPGQGTVASMIYRIFGSYAAGALNVAKCESGLNPNSYNPTSIGGSHAEGVFQILYPGTWMSTSEASSSPYNAQANILAAHEIFVRDGYNWHEWSCAA